MANPELVLLGGPDSGKTHYAGQLYGRLRRRPGLLRLRERDGTPADLGVLEEVLACLEEGRAAEHTSTQSWGELRLPLVTDDGRELDTSWPDYGGEQVREMSKQREIPDEWCARLVRADAWVTMIRLRSEKVYTDALERLRDGKAPKPRVESPSAVFTWDANARWVELLQMLLFVASHGTARRLSHPRLVVLLSCYDQVETSGRTPREVLASELPLVSAFVEANWSPGAATVWGLSALGRLLERDSRDEEFINQGPEYHGWVDQPDGERSDDLSLPLAWLLEAT